MKRTLLFIACVLASVAMVAQEGQTDYIPFVEMGKQWHVVRSGFSRGYHFDQYTLMNEEVKKNGKTYVEMCRTEDDLTVVYDAGLLREEDRKVYFFNSDTQKEFLMFDYSLKEGDTYETYSFDEQKMVKYEVRSVEDYTEGPEVTLHRHDEIADTMNTQHRYLRKWTVSRTDDDSFQKTWIEGVGSLEGPFANLYDTRPISSMDYLAYVEGLHGDLYLPFSFSDIFRQIHGSNLPTGKAGYSESDRHHQLTYEQEGDRLHICGKVFTQCGPNNYAYFIEEPTEDPLVCKLYFEIQEVEPLADCMALHHTDFYVYGFDPSITYVVIDNHGEEHPVINKTPQMAYRPFIEDGKVWKVGDYDSGNPVKLVDYYYFGGDTIISGKTCKQMMCQRYISPDYSGYDTLEDIYSSQGYVGAWYEEDKKVFTYDSTDKQFKLMYDFSLGDNDTLQINDQLYITGLRQTGGIKGFKGVYRDITNNMAWKTTWLEGVGSLYSPIINIYPGRLNPLWFLMSCSVGDEVIYLNDVYEDGATPEVLETRTTRFDFTHTVKTKPKAPTNRVAEAENTTQLYGEYNEKQLEIYLDPLDNAYLVRITDDTGKNVYKKIVNAGNIVALCIDISSYPQRHYTVTVENSQESFTGEFGVLTTGIKEQKNQAIAQGHIYNLQGQRLSFVQKGLNIVNGKKIMVYQR